LTDVESDNFKIYITWLPILGPDNSDTATLRTSEFHDDRLTYFWDGGRLTQNRWQQVLNLKSKPWDSYFLYGASAHWRTGITPPDLWQHKLGIFRTIAPRFNKVQMEKYIKEKLTEVKVVDSKTK